jgi:hypothetical protein
MNAIRQMVLLVAGFVWRELGGTGLLALLSFDIPLFTLSPTSHG